MKPVGRATGASETILASDLVKLMAVVEAAAGLYNELERAKTTMTIALGDDFEMWVAWDSLGQRLRELGLNEVHG